MFESTWSGRGAASGVLGIQVGLLVAGQGGHFRFFWSINLGASKSKLCCLQQVDAVYSLVFMGRDLVAATRLVLCTKLREFEQAGVLGQSGR